MKRGTFLLVLPILLLLYGCGGGGGAVDGGARNVPPNTPTGTINIRITQAPQHAAAVLPNYSTQLRVVVNNAALRVNNLPFKVHKDITLGGTVTLSLPKASGYTIEAVTYAKDGTLKRLIKYGIAPGVNIAPGANPDVVLTMVPVQASLILPASITASTVAPNGGGYSTSYNYFPVQSNVSTAAGRNATPLQWWALTTSKLDEMITSPVHNQYGGSPLAPRTIAAPLSFTSGTLYFQAEFFIKKSLLETDENYLEWTFNYPNPAFPFSDPPLGVPLVVESGNVVISPQ